MRFRAGDRICLAPFVLHSDPELFPDPLQFRPSRYDAGTSFAKGGRAVHEPVVAFGGGSTMCPGMWAAWSAWSGG